MIEIKFFKSFNDFNEMVDNQINSKIVERSETDFYGFIKLDNVFNYLKVYENKKLIGYVSIFGKSIKIVLDRKDEELEKRVLTIVKNMYNL